MHAVETSAPVHPAVTAPSEERVHGPRLAGGWRIAGISAWALIWFASLAVFFYAIYLWFRWDASPAANLHLWFPDIQPENVAGATTYKNALQGLGISLPFYGGMFAALRLVSGLPYFLLSVLIVRRRNDRLMAVLFAIVLAVIGAAGRWIQANWQPVGSSFPPAAPLVLLLSFLLDCSVIMFYTFPDGRFVPRWTRWLAGVVVVVSFLNNFFRDTLVDPVHLLSPWWLQPKRLLLLAGFIALAYRYRRMANPVQKQQIKWIVAGTALLELFYLAHTLIYDSPLLQGVNLTLRDSIILELVLEPGWYLAQSLFAICIGLSVFHYRLWEIDLVVNRVLVYGSLTLLTMGAYLAVVTALGAMFRSMAGAMAAFLATGLVAILFEPLRLRLQRLVNRLMYGERDDPYAVLTRLSNTLEQTPSPAETLPAIASTVGQALKVPYVAIQVREGQSDKVLAFYGTPQGETETFPLIYQAETIGVLRVALRAWGEPFAAVDRRLIENIARQAGTAAHAVRLTADLVRSRAEIVTAREEERRRLRRDLHDGLGPILASQTLKMAAVRQLVRQDPERAETLVENVIQQNESTVGEVRRLVYGLRPPALDELGVVEAVRDLVRRGGDDLSESGMRIEVEGPAEGLPRLPAAVEVNAYRIALEALTNAARHAQATECHVRFLCAMDTQPPGLLVEVCDNGIGIPEHYRAGVGLRSMRERTEELGGRLEIRLNEPRGTWITALLPMVGREHCN